MAAAAVPAISREQAARDLIDLHGRLGYVQERIATMRAVGFRKSYDYWCLHRRGIMDQIRQAEGVLRAG